MGSYSKDYFILINNGLEKTIVSDSQGKIMDVDSALKLWAEKAHELKTKTKGLIFFCGNGASATMAEHMSHDWFQNAQINTTTVAEVAHLTAISNDVGYEDVFSYRVGRILSEKDIFVGISSSGNSPNIVKAFIAARSKGAFTISVSGKDFDNKIRNMAELNFYVPLETYGAVESAHAVLLHCALDYYLDEYMGGRH